MANNNATYSGDNEAAIFIKNARIFDGTGMAAYTGDVLIEGAKISAVGAGLAAPKGAAIIDAGGKTLIPGLHDLHTHLRSPAMFVAEDLGKVYAEHLLAGITTVSDFSVSGEMIAPIRALTSVGGAFSAPNLLLSVRFGVPGGHGTEHGWGDRFTLEVATARAAHMKTPAALGYKPDILKVFADGWRYGRDEDLSSMNLSTLKAIVDDAHGAGVPVVTHTVTLEGAKLAAAAGVDALGHGIGDALADEELIALMHANGTGYIATLVVYEPQQTRKFSPSEWALMSARERAREEELDASGRGEILPYDARRWDIMQRNITLLKEAGIKIGIGTDAGLLGVYHGSSAHREIAWLTKLGFSAAEALVAATRTSAEIMHLESDRGTIAAGMRADLVLVGGRPDEAIADLGNIAGVWCSGVEAPLAKMREIAESDAPTPLPATKMTGDIWARENEGLRSALGTLPVASTDSGVDHSILIEAKTSAKGAVILAAKMGAAPRPFVRWTVPLTPGNVMLGDASAFRGIAITAKGEGEQRLILESYGVSITDWFAVPFAASGGEVLLPFSAFKSANEGVVLDSASLRAVIIELAGASGELAALEIAGIRFY